MRTAALVMGGIIAAASRVAAEPRRPVPEPATAEDDWRVTVGLFGAAFGPVTYDRQSAGSTAAGADPQLGSLGLRLGWERPLRYGLLDLHAAGRFYQTVENRTTARFTGGAASYSEVTEIQSHGFGVGTGWLFRTPARETILYPLASVELERDGLTVRTRSTDAAGASFADKRRDSVLYVGYFALGARWRVLSRPFDAAIQAALTLPWFVNAPAGLNEHRTKPGLELGAALTLAPTALERPPPHLPRAGRPEDGP